MIPTRTSVLCKNIALPSLVKNVCCEHNPSCNTHIRKHTYCSTNLMKCSRDRVVKFWCKFNHCLETQPLCLFVWLCPVTFVSVKDASVLLRDNRGEHEIGWKKRADQYVEIKEGWDRIGDVSPVCHFSEDYSLRSGAWTEWWLLIILFALLMSGSQCSSSLWKPTKAHHRARW